MVAFDGTDYGEGITPLPIYPWEAVYANLGAVKEAFVSLGLPNRVQPCEGLPGSPGTILAIGEKPNFPCDHALVSSVRSPGLSYAIKCCVLGLKDDRIVDSWTAAEDILRDVFGEIKFIEEVQLVNGQA